MKFWLPGHTDGVGETVDLVVLVVMEVVDRLDVVVVLLDVVARDVVVLDVDETVEREVVVDD